MIPVVEQKTHVKYLVFISNLSFISSLSLFTVSILSR